MSIRHIADIVASILGPTLLGPIAMKLFTPCTALFPVETGVQRDSIHPRRELRFTPEVIQPLKGPEERLLRQVGGIGQRAGHTISQRVYHTLMAQHQFPEGLRIALAASANPSHLILRVAHAPSVDLYDNRPRGIL
jgi:hypothetical protein